MFDLFLNGCRKLPTYSYIVRNAFFVGENGTSICELFYGCWIVGFDFNAEGFTVGEQMTRVSIGHLKQSGK